MKYAAMTLVDKKAQPDGAPPQSPAVDWVVAPLIPPPPGKPFAADENHLAGVKKTTNPLQAGRLCSRKPLNMNYFLTTA